MHVDFVDSVKASAKGAQIHGIDKQFHIFTIPARAQDATQDKNSGDGTVSAVGSKAGPNKPMGGTQKSCKNAKPPPHPPFVSKTGKEIIPVQEEIEEDCDDENGSQTDILVNTKAGAGNAAGITSSMIQTENSKQANEKLTQDQSGCAEDHVPQLEERDTKEDDTASINAPMVTIPETLTNKVQTRSKDDKNTDYSHDEVADPVQSSDSISISNKESPSKSTDEDIK